MAFEFMTWATAFALLNFIGFIFILYLFSRGARKLYASLTKGSFSFPKEFYFLLVLGALYIFLGSAAQPKLSIDPVQNRQLLEYQNNNQEVIIETPPPRTEKLEGFTPMK